MRQHAMLLRCILIRRCIGSLTSSICYQRIANVKVWRSLKSGWMRPWRKLNTMISNQQSMLQTHWYPCKTTVSIGWRYNIRAYQQRKLTSSTDHISLTPLAFTEYYPKLSKHTQITSRIHRHWIWVRATSMASTLRASPRTNRKEACYHHYGVCILSSWNMPIQMITNPRSWMF